MFQHPSIFVMDKNAVPFETLKQILRHVRDPERLDDHPWTQSLIVQESLADAPGMSQTSPGQQLVSALARLFPQLQPAAPPRCGKRLDPRWGEFGLLAALYFTPFNNGKAFPTSLLDAWRHIDPAILYFVYGKPVETLAADEIKRYQLVGTDLEYAAASTLSDWHKKGLQRFTEIILNRERFLSRASVQPSIILNPGQAGSIETAQTRRRNRFYHIRRPLWLALCLFLLVALGLGSLKAWRIYDRGRLVYGEVTHLKELVRAPIEVGTIETIVPMLKTLQGDLSAFKEEAQPVLWLAPHLDWVPVYGKDLASGPALIQLAEHLVSVSILSSQAAQPLLNEFNSQGSTLDPAGLTALLVQAQPELGEARRELDQALATREIIQVERLSPRLQNLLVEELDPVLNLADKGLALAMALPGILGAASEGPKTYMLLPENEDELRPTGGFITSVGNLVLHNGRVIGLDFESIDNDQVDWSKPYPVAPWQLREYMNSRVLLLRDANWFTDFPTTVLWVEYLFAYTHSHSVDGVIAFDQHFLVMLLGELGPLEVEGAPYPITDQNVLEYMRQAKVPPAGETIPEGWYRKEFIRKLADAMLAELTGGSHHDWRGIAGVLIRALAERHLLLQFDDSVIAGLIAERGWDNAVRPGEGDYLMVADANIGFNKTNAVVDVSLSYDVDLTDVSAPRGTLVVTHKNNARQDVPCMHSPAPYVPGEEWYRINSCYWDYLRVYKQEGVDLLDAAPHAVPADWMVLGEGIPARVDTLDEGLPGVQAFGTLLVVPGGRSLNTSFTFALPDVAPASKEAPGEYLYRLKVQKQPGTLAIPITIRIHLPNHASVISTSPDATLQGNNLLIEMNLRTDIDFEVKFSLP